MKNISSESMDYVWKTGANRCIYHWLAIEHHHYQKALHWIARFSTPLRTLDALHLAIAATESADLFTADTQLAKAAREFGVAVTLIG